MKNKSPNHHHKETHGMRDDIDDSTPLSDVKAPNVLERAKEEIEALVQTIHHPKKESHTHEKRDQSTEAIPKADHSNSSSGSVTVLLAAKDEGKAPNFIQRAKEELGEFIHHKSSPRHHKETHGMSGDIDENTPISEIKGPSVFERAKEEIEAIVQTIHPKKEPSHLPEKEEGGLRHSIGKGLEKVCSPFGHKRD